MYPTVSLYIDGTWTQGTGGRSGPILCPATGDEIGRVPHATTADLDRALHAADRAFKSWKRVAAFDRYKLMRRAADILRADVDAAAAMMTREQGKPLAQAKGEVLSSADLIDWFAEEGRRAYGRIVPPRAEVTRQVVLKEPVGPVAAFTPWNFPINQAARKICGALAAGCSIIIKGPEEAPASCAALVRAFAAAGVPAGVLNLVYGIPSEISEYLIPHPVIRKVSFTGSTAVGKKLAALAGAHMKRVTMELGGHAPAIVFGDADLDATVKILVDNKYRNAGQVCTSPTRLMIQEPLYDKFVDKFIAAAKSVKVGDGFDQDTQMGPLANVRRIEAMDMFIGDAVAKGAKLRAGGHRIGNKGNFYAPTVLTEVPLGARIMNEEPFGPVAPIIPFKDFESAVAEANRLPYGLAAYAYTRSERTAAAIGEALESGMVCLNAPGGMGVPEMPFGGIKDSGFGAEGGTEALESYLNTKLIVQIAT